VAPAAASDRRLPFVELLMAFGSVVMYSPASNNVTSIRPFGSGIGSLNSRFQPVLLVNRSPATKAPDDCPALTGGAFFSSVNEEHTSRIVGSIGDMGRKGERAEM
jgi:hypothetical protein